jgi:DNA-binding PadR family transcriptional regulator
MPDPPERPLSLIEWVVLCTACEKPTYGSVVAGLFSRGGSLGRVWLVSKAGVYRAIPRLEQLALVRTLGPQRAEDAPPHWMITATPAGRQAARVWLRTPVAHGREVRSELMIKLTLLDRARGNPQDLLRRQLAAFGALAAALADRVITTTGSEHTLALWRHEMMSGTIEFLDQAAWQAELAAASGPGRHPRSRQLPLPPRAKDHEARSSLETKSTIWHEPRLG